MTRVLALDCAGKCGFAVSGSDFHGVKDIRPQLNQRPGIRYQRLIRLMDSALQQFPDLDLIAYEEPIPNHSGMAAAELAWGYVAIIKLWCAEYEIAVRGVYISSWKKYVTGHGTASKQMVMAAVRHLGYHPEDDNHADAIGVMLYAIQSGAKEASLF